MYKIIFSDMDETFLGEGHKIPAPNYEALARMKELGVMFVPTSGRGYFSIMDNFADVDPAIMEGSYVISYNGGSINRVGDPEPITEHHLDHDLANELWAIGYERGMCMHAYTPEAPIYIINLPESERRYLTGLKDLVEIDSPTLDAYPVISKVIYCGEDMDEIHRFADEVVAPMLGDKADITFSSGRYLEVVPAGVSKGNGLRELAGMLGIDIADTVAVGDAPNDLEMLKAAGCSVGVANIDDECRPYCDVVLNTKGPDGAFPELLDRLF